MGYLICKKNVKECAVAKKKLKEVLKTKSIIVDKLLKEAKVSKPLYNHSQNGKHVMVSSAKRICKYLNVKYSDYFTTVVDKQEYAKATINAYRKSLCAILASAKRQRLIDHNFASRDYIEAVTGSKKEIETLNENEAKQLEEILEKEPNIEKQTSLMIPLMLGLRRGEIMGLEWKDIDFNKNTMKIQRSSIRIQTYGIITKEPKTETSIREITMPDILVEQLKKYKIWWDKNKSNIHVNNPEWCDRLFINQYGNIYDSNTFRLWLQKLLEKNGMKVVTLHSLRHTNISLQLMAGIDVKTVASRVGHSQASTTSDIYSHFMKSGDIKACKVLDSIFNDVDSK